LRALHRIAGEEQHQMAAILALARLGEDEEATVAQPHHRLGAFVVRP